MAYDLVTWSPRISASGDDKYNVLGGTKLDASIDTGLPTRIDAGSSSYSSTPTISEINAGSGLNQVIAAINRRAAVHNSLFGTTIPVLSYIAPDVRISAAKFLEIQTGINNVRRTEGFTSNGSFTTPVAGNRILGTSIAEMRKALAISGTFAPHATTHTAYDAADTRRQYRRIDNPYGTPTSETIVGPTGDANIARVYWEKSGANYLRYRLLVSYRIPEWMTTIVSCVFQTSLSLSTGSATPMTYRLYRPNAPGRYPSPAISDFYATDNLLYTLATVFSSVTDNTTDLTIANVVVTALAGGYLTFLSGWDVDFDDTGSTFATTRLGLQDWYLTPSGGRGGVVIDLG